MLTFFFFLLVAVVTLGASNELRIHDASEFIAFSKNSSSYTGITVYLESDLDFSNGLSDQFVSKSSFDGTFDGQGHTISDLAIKSSSANVGLFGYSSGTIKNVVLDSSCSVTGNFTGNENVCVGGVIGQLYTANVPSSVSNIVNMAGVTFEGNTTGPSGILSLGGIAGYIYFYVNSDAMVKNCANYGSLRNSGAASKSVYIGGIAGVIILSSQKSLLVQNCFNYGAITATGAAESIYVGGIVGHSKYVILKNCVSAGKISSPTESTVYKGSIIGYIKSSATIEHCLWTNDVGCEGVNGTGTPLTIKESLLVSINATTVGNLNEYASKNNGWNKWLLNENNKSVSFKINSNENGFTLSSQLILLPGIDAESESGLEFSGWFSDSYCNEPFVSSQINEDTTLYGLYGEIIFITFNPNGGTVSPYSKRVVVNGTYGTLPVPNRTNFTFNGWFTEKNESVTNETAVVISRNHTLVAQWDGISLPQSESSSSQKVAPSKQVEIIFGAKDLTVDSAKEIIGKYADDDDFKIVGFEKKEDGVRVIIEFIDKKEAENFITNVEASSEKTGKIIKKVGFIDGKYDGSFSAALCPFTVFFFLQLI